MVNNFKVGVNFDFDLLDAIGNINQYIGGSNRVTELYGSDRFHHDLAARPAFRLPDIDHKHFEEYVKKAAGLGIDFNYTMNSIIPYGSKPEFVKHIPDIVEFVKYCESIGVKRITVANPMMLEVIRNIAKSDIEIEVSTIMHVDTITQIKYLHEKYGVNKICCNLNKNRDFTFLERAARYCNANGIILELMVNEFCGVGGSDYATHCVYRDSCYICHAMNRTLEDTLTLNEYPMGLCTPSRNENPANWLRLKFIRPEDIKHYNAIGINHFKITGRTGSTAYILKTVSSYLNESFDGNLLELWKPLESIKDSSVENVFPYNIANKKLNGFLSHWYDLKANCDNEVCGETCKYCDMWYKNLRGENDG